MEIDMDVIDPEIEGALDEAIKTPVSDGVTILQLVNGKKLKIRYKPQGIGQMMQAVNGTPTKRKSNDFRYDLWAKEVLSRLNMALLNVQIVDDLSGKRPGKGEIPLSLIPSGEYYRIFELCFPGYADDPKDSGNEYSPVNRKAGKGVSRGPSISADDGELR